jgi:hypothetical protein
MKCGSNMESRFIREARRDGSISSGSACAAARDASAACHLLSASANCSTGSKDTGEGSFVEEEMGVSSEVAMVNSLESILGVS